VDEGLADASEVGYAATLRGGGMRSVCVFCGSSPGAKPVFASAAARVGHLLAAQGRVLVYGGGAVGLMGGVADAALEDGATVIGVITRSLVQAEVSHQGVTELKVVDTMHERKALMAKMADGFVALPGGVGTLEELLEVFTWGQLGLHAKPCGLLNVAGFYGPLLEFLDRLVGERFLRREHRETLLVDDDPGRLLERMDRFVPVALPKWLDRSGG
jgi:uncharacterized protein (TIGR00730 family)